MAVLTNVQVVGVFYNGESDLLAVYALRKVSTGDTFDLQADFSSPRQAFLIGTTVIGQEPCTIAGTVVTVPSGLINDAGWMMVWGAHA
jgi:hypothetical protein